MYLDANNLYGWAMSQKLPVGGFKLEKILILKTVTKDIFLKQMLNMLEKFLFNKHTDLPFLPEKI